MQANGDMYDKAAPKMGNRAGILGRVAGRADRRRPDAPPAAEPTDGARLFAKADFTRDDAWLANPEAIIPIMAYRQPKAETRTTIIAYLKELN